MIHSRYYNDKSNRIFTTGQLFCMSTKYTNVLQLPRFILKGEDFTEGHLDKSLLLALRDDIINNLDSNYSNANFQPCRNFTGGAIDITSNRQIYKKNFSQVPLIKNLVDTFKIMFPYLSVDLVWLLGKSKEGDGFQGWHKDFALGQQITKTIVINLGSKEKGEEETTRSFNSSVSFEADDWYEIEEYALSEINLEHGLSQDESKPAAIPNNKPSAKPSAIPHNKPSAIPAAILHKKPSAVPQEELKNSDDIAEDERKPAAIRQEEMKPTLVTAQPIQYTRCHTACHQSLWWLWCSGSKWARGGLFTLSVG
jgi:hypothetical protein